MNEVQTMLSEINWAKFILFSDTTGWDALPKRMLNAQTY